MAKLHVLCDNETEKRLIFFCPGCRHYHWFRVRGAEPVWQWNGDMETPTVSPSILVMAGSDPALRCHSYVRAGRIEFLSDCGHILKGQTVELPDANPELVREPRQ